MNVPYEPQPQTGSGPVSPVQPPSRPLSRAKILWMVQTAILAAILLVMAFTPLGYLKYGTISITFLTLPVVVAAIVVGPASGAVLGAVFGLTSFAQCFGLDPFGAALLGINPILTFILCMVPRVLMGWLVGLIFMALTKVDRTKWISFGVASLSGALINTVLFVGALVWFFFDFLRQFGDTLWKILTVLVTFNAALEAGVVLVVGTAITKALGAAMGRRSAGKTA